jgi:uncharacterized lipoprotein YehR (DUF1307 family)
MKIVKSILLIVMLLCLSIVAGCNEGYTSQSYSTDNFTWERSATGFWQPKIDHTQSSDVEYELSRK